MDPAITKYSKLLKMPPYLLICLMLLESSINLSSVQQSLGFAPFIFVSSKIAEANFLFTH